MPFYMFGLGRKGRLRYSPESGSTVRQLSPINDNGEATQYISIPALDIPKLAERYIAAMMTEESADWCRCEWVIHPDDTEVKSGTCRECGIRRDKHWSTGKEIGENTHGVFLGKRMRRGEEAPDCPVHTREGLVIYFFEWVFSHGE